MQDKRKPEREPRAFPAYDDAAHIDSAAVAPIRDVLPETQGKALNKAAGALVASVFCVRPHTSCNRWEKQENRLCSQKQ